MKSWNLVVLIIIVLVQSCNKNDDDNPTIRAPREITLISGNNQTGYPSQALPDSIVIEISVDKTEDLYNYSYYFKTAGYGSSILSRSYIVNNSLFISASWRISGETTSHELKFYLTEKCGQHNYPSDCKIIDSLSIIALTKNPWVKVYSGDSWSLYDMHFSDANTGIAIGYLPFSTGFLKTTNGGGSWTMASTSRNDMYQLSFCNSDTGIVILTNNYAYFTNDGGQSFYQGDWTPPITGHLSSTDYFMQSSKTIITVGRKGAIARTVDGGVTWKTYQGFTFINWLYAVTCPDKNVCYACGEVAKVIKSLDGGESWFEQEVLINNYLKTIYFLDTNFGFCAGDYGAVIRTTDGGSHWEIINTGLRFPIIEISFLTRDLGYIVSTSGEIGETRDGGITWNLINRDNYGVYDLTKAYFKGQSIFGLQGGSIYKFDLNN